MLPPLFDLRGHVAIVTGANHGIGAATARALAACGARVHLSYSRITVPDDAGIPESHRRSRACNAENVIASITEAGGDAVAV